jgi:hypothetical protein
MANVANTNIANIKPPKAPNLPIPPNAYSQEYLNILTNALRLYFNQLDLLGKYLVTPNVGYYLNSPYGAFADTTDQPASGVGAADAVTFDTQTVYDINTIFMGGQPDVYIDPTVSTSAVFVLFPAIYNFTYSLQLSKTSGTTANIYVWLRVNGTTDVALSVSNYVINGANTKLNISNNVMYEILPVSAPNFVELMWSTDDATVKLDASAAAAPVPAIPSATLAVSFVSA